MSDPAEAWAELDELEFGVIVEGPDAQATAKATVSGTRFTLVTSDGAEPIEGSLSEVVLQLAFLVALGPRDRPTETSAVLVADEIETASRSALLSAWDPETLAASPLGVDGVVVWTAWAAWPDPGEPDAILMRELIVADAGSGGIAIVELDDDGGAVVRPCSSTDVWAGLAALLPRPFEVREPMAAGQDA